MPLTAKGNEILASMRKTYGSPEKAKEVFYASKNAGKITGVDARDMEPGALEELSRLFAEFMKEESREPAHRQEGEDDWSPEARKAAAEARKRNAHHYNAGMYAAFNKQPYKNPHQRGTEQHAAYHEGYHRTKMIKSRSRDSALAGDSRKGLHNMPKTKLSAATVRGALMNYLAPRLAADAKPPALMPIVQGITNANFVAKIPEIVSKLRVASHGRLAQDADLEDAAEILEAIARMTEGEEMEEEAGEDDLDPNSGMPMAAGEEGGEDEEEEEKKDGEEGHSRHVELLRRVRQFCDGKMSPEDCAKLDEMIGEVSARPAEDDEDDEEDDGQGQDDPPPFEGKPEVGGRMREEREEMKEKAMDSASVARVVQAAVIRERERGRSVAAAVEHVRPWIGAADGKLLALDSAAAVYAHALKALGVDTKGLHPDAYKPILEAQPRPGSRRQDNRVALDAAATKSFSERFPHAARVQRA